MGRNAQRRRAAKAEHKAANAHVLRFHRSTRTLRQLREQMLHVTTMQQFEEIVRQAHPDHRGTTRRFLERMLRPNLPCCGAGALAKAIGQEILPGQHGLLCPTRNRVELE